MEFSLNATFGGLFLRYYSIVLELVSHIFLQVSLVRSSVQWFYFSSFFSRRCVSRSDRIKFVLALAGVGTIYSYSFSVRGKSHTLYVHLFQPILYFPARCTRCRATFLWVYPPALIGVVLHLGLSVFCLVIPNVQD